MSSSPIASVAACVALLACVAGAGEPVAAADPPALLIEHTAPLLAEVQRRLGSEASVLSLTVSLEEASIDVHDPQNALHVDRYGYRDGALTSPEPVPVGRNRRQLKARLFPLKEIDLAVLPRIVSAAPAAVRAEDGRVTHATVERSEGWNTDSSWSRPHWRVYVEGPRGGGYVEYRLDGKPGRVMRW